MYLECPYKLPAALLRTIAMRVVLLDAKIQHEILGEWDIDLKTEQLLRYAIEPILRQYILDYPHDDYAVAEVMLSKLYAECGQKSLYGLDVYERELEQISYRLLDRHEQLIASLNSVCSTNSSE